MRRRVVALSAVALLGLSAAAVGSASAVTGPSSTSAAETMPFVQSSTPDRVGFRHIDRAIGRRALHVPASVQRNTAITATVVLAGDSVADAVINERASGRGMDRAQRSSKRRSVASAQSPVVDRIRATGASVLFVMQDALNGVVVRATPAQLASIASISGVASVARGYRVQQTNTTANRVTGVPTVWQNLGFTGTGQTIAIIDTGIDYLHADFGGNGSIDDFTGNDTTLIEPGSFPTVKVVGGYDFVGDAYDSAGDTLESLLPNPDPDPLDCAGHGTHVAGTAAGIGVNTDGTAYAGPYTEDAVASLRIGPGAAPGASLLAYRIFGCAGSTDSPVIIAAIDRAWRDGATVANLSLGASSGTPDDLEAAIINRVSRAGMLVVASAGNSGNVPYLVGSPSTSDRALSVAAYDGIATFPSGTLSLSPTGTVALLNANDATFSLSAEVYVLDDGSGGIALGCDAADYPPAVAGKIVVTLRGVCARVDRATLGQAAGAVAVIMVNNTDGYPIFEGPIEGVSIPFLGATPDDAATLQAAHGTTVSLASGTTMPNPSADHVADFSSGGPRTGDSAQKPEVAAPGVDVFSAAVGTGSGGIYESGTSMSAPHTSGIAALVRAAHPAWSPAEVKAAIIDTASDDGIVGYSTLLLGSGLVSAVGAVSATAVAVTEDGKNTLSFGYDPTRGRVEDERSFTIVNDAPSAVTYDLHAVPNGSIWSEQIRIEPSQVTVPAGGKRKVRVRITLGRSAIHALPSVSFDAVGPSALTTVSGIIEATPQAPVQPVSGARPRWNALRIPYLMVPRGESDIEVGEPHKVNLRRSGVRAFVAETRNKGVHDGYADVYAWQLSDRRGDATSQADLLSAGIQTFTLDAPGDDRIMVLAVNVAGTRSSAASKEIDVPIYVDGDSDPDFVVVGSDLGWFLDGDANGIFGVVVIRMSDGEIVDAFQGDAPMNGSTVLLPFLASDIGVSSDAPWFRYGVSSMDFAPYSYDEFVGLAAWNPYDPPVMTGQGAPLEAGGKGALTFLDRGKKAAKESGVKGYLVVTLDDRNGIEQADRVDLR